MQSKIHVAVNGSPFGSMTADAADVDKIMDLFPQRCAELGRAPLEVARLGISRLASGEPATDAEQAVPELPALHS